MTNNEGGERFERKVDLIDDISLTSVTSSIKRHVKDGTFYLSIINRIDELVEEKMNGYSSCPNSYTITSVRKIHKKLLEQKKKQLEESKPFRMEHFSHCMADETLLIVVTAAFLYNMHCELIEPTKKDTRKHSKEIDNEIEEDTDFKREILKFDPQLVDLAIGKIKGVKFDEQHKEDAIKFLNGYLADQNDSQRRDNLCDYMMDEDCDRSLIHLKTKFLHITEGDLLQNLLGNTYSTFWKGNEEALQSNLNTIKDSLIQDRKHNGKNNKLCESFRRIEEDLNTFSSKIKAIPGLRLVIIKELTQRINDKYQTHVREKYEGELSRAKHQRELLEEQMNDKEKVLEEKLKELQQKLVNEQKSSEEQRRHSAKQEAAAKLQALITIRNNVSLLREERESLKGKAQELDSSVDKLKTFYEDRITVLEKQTENLLQEKSELEQWKYRLQSDADEMKTQIYAVTTELKETQESSDKLKSWADKLHNECQEERKKNFVLEEACHELQRERDNLQAKLKIAIMQLKRNPTKNSDSYQSVGRAENLNSNALSIDGESWEEFLVVNNLEDEEDQQQMSSRSPGSKMSNGTKNRSNAIVGLWQNLNGSSQAKIDELEQKDIKYRQEIANLEEKVEELRLKLEGSTKKEEELLSQISLLEDQMQVLGSRTQLLESKNGVLASKNRQHVTKINDQERRIKGLDEEKLLLGDRLKKVTDKLAEQKSSNDGLVKQLRKHDEEIIKLKSNEERLQLRIDGFKVREKELETKVKLKSTQIKEREAKELEINKKEEQISVLKSEKNKFTDECSTLTAHNANLQTSNENLLEENRNKEQTIRELNSRL